MTNTDAGQMHGQPCDVCGEGVKRFGTSTDLEVFYEDYKYALYPAFCSWNHAAEWFARPQPDFATLDRSHHTNGGFQYWGSAIALVFLALSLYGLASLIRTVL